MRIRALLAILIVSASLAVAGQGITPPPPPPPPATEEPMGAPQNTVIVSGTATVAMVPDIVSFDLGVHTEGPQIRVIVEENSAKVAAIVSGLKSRGVTSRELKTSSFQLSSVEQDDQPAGYRVTNQIGVTRRGTVDAADLIALAIEAGANDVRGPEFSVTNEKSVQDRCLEMAFGDAKRKAERLAALSMRPLGKVMAITDGSSSPFEFKYRTPGVEGGAAGGVSFEPGVHTIECGVTIAFALE